MLPSVASLPTSEPWASEVWRLAMMGGGSELPGSSRSVCTGTRVPESTAESPSLRQAPLCQEVPRGSSLEWSHSSASDPGQLPVSWDPDGRTGVRRVFTAEELELLPGALAHLIHCDSIRSSFLPDANVPAAERKEAICFKCPYYYYLVGRTLLMPSRHHGAFRGPLSLGVPDTSPTLRAV